MEINSIWHGDRSKKQISLSFDDGPNPYWTPEILNILDNYKIKAIFFVLGKYAEKYPEIIKETINRGHLIGNHSYSHEDLGGYTNFEKCDSLLKQKFDLEVKYVRPPYNKTDWLHKYKKAVSGEILVINNDVVTKDWESSKDIIYERAVSKTSGGSILLFHDGSQNEDELKDRPRNTVDILPKIIEKLSEEYEIVRLDELL